MEQKEQLLKLMVFGYVRISNKEYISKHLSELIYSFCNTYLKFLENESSLFNVTNNGWKATLNKGFGTIQIGDFFKLNDEIIVKLKLKMENCDAACCGIGFITHKFNDFDHGNDYDLDNNNGSMYLYGNGFYKTCKIFDKSLKDTNTFIKYQWFDMDDFVSIKINTISKQVIIWNNDIDINHLHIDEINYVFFIKLPINHNNNIALMIDMGSKQQTISIVDQIIEFV